MQWQLEEALSLYVRWAWPRDHHILEFCVTIADSIATSVKWCVERFFFSFDDVSRVQIEAQKTSEKVLATFCVLFTLQESDRTLILQWIDSSCCEMYSVENKTLKVSDTLDVLSSWTKDKFVFWIYLDLPDIRLCVCTCGDGCKSCACHTSFVE